MTPSPITRAPEGAGTGTATPDPVAEIVTFRLVPGADAQAFVKAAEAIEPLLRDSGGMIQRTLSVDETGLWTDHIIWTSMETAKTAAASVMQQPGFKPFSDMISGDGMTMRHAPVRLQIQ